MVPLAWGTMWDVADAIVRGYLKLRAVSLATAGLPGGPIVDTADGAVTLMMQGRAYNATDVRPVTVTGRDIAGGRAWSALNGALLPEYWSGDGHEQTGCGRCCSETRGHRGLGPQDFS